MPCRYRHATAAFVSTALGLCSPAVLGQERASEPPQNGNSEQDADDQRPKSSGAALMEEMVVTTTRREVSSQDVGVSVAAFSQEQLSALGINTGGDLTEITPNFDVVRSYAAKGFNNQLTIRGVGQPDFGDNTEATVTSYVDEFYLIGAGTADFLLHHLDRAEVARGPQGTVQGRNSTAGSVNFFTHLPEFEFSSGLRATYGRFDLVEVSGHVNVPITDRWAIRVSGALEENDNYIVNINPDRLFDGQGESEFHTVRVSSLFEPTDRLRFLLKFELGDMGPAAAQIEQSLQVGVNPAGTETIRVDTDIFGNNEENIGAGSPDVVNIDGPNSIAHEILHGYGRVDWDLTDNMTWTVLGGYLDSDKQAVEDCDDSLLPICLFSNLATSEHWLVESRLDYRMDRFRVIFGANYMEQFIDSTAVTPIFFDVPTSEAAGFGGALLAQFFNDQQDLDSWAVFGQAEFDITPQLTLIGGVRFTQDEKVFDAEFALGPVPTDTQIPRTIEDFLTIRDLILAGDPSFTIFNTETVGDLATLEDNVINATLQLDWRPTDNQLYYAAYRRGVKSGGFITGNVGVGFPAEQRPYDEETNNAYEIGAKTDWMDGRLRVNGAAFFYDYNDLQNTGFIGLTNVITNNDTIVYGGELEVWMFPVEGLSIIAGLGFTESDVEDIANAQGVVEDRTLPLSPRWSGNATVRYERPLLGGYGFVQGSFRGQTERFRDSLNNPSIILEGFDVWDGRIGYASEDGDWGVEFFLENIFDSRHAITRFDLSALGNTGEVAFNPPRWWGISLFYNFR